MGTQLSRYPPGHPDWPSHMQLLMTGLASVSRKNRAYGRTIKGLRIGVTKPESAEASRTQKVGGL